GRQGVEVVGVVGAGGGVHADAALARQEVVELVVDDEAGGVFLLLVEVGEEALELLGIGRLRQPLGLPGQVRGLDGGERLLLARPVAGADVRGPLEGHVLEHVGEAGDPGHLLRRADVGHGAEGEDRRARALDDEEGPAVGQLVDGGPLLEGGEVLGGGRRGAADPAQEPDRSDRGSERSTTMSIHGKVLVEGWSKRRIRSLAYRERVRACSRSSPGSVLSTSPGVSQARRACSTPKRMRSSSVVRWESVLTTILQPSSRASRRWESLRSSRCGLEFSSTATPSAAARRSTVSMSSAAGLRRLISRAVGWQKMLTAGCSRARRTRAVCSASGRSRREWSETRTTSRPASISSSRSRLPSARMSISIALRIRISGWRRWIPSISFHCRRRR